MRTVQFFFTTKALLAWDLVLWLFWLPVMLRLYTVPILLKRLAESKKRIKKDADGVKGARQCTCLSEI